MKHLVATSIAAHSVPCFPPQPLLFSISRGLYTSCIKDFSHHIEIEDVSIFPLSKSEINIYSL